MCRWSTNARTSERRTCAANYRPERPPRSPLPGWPALTPSGTSGRRKDSMIATLRRSATAREPAKPAERAQRSMTPGSARGGAMNQIELAGLCIAFERAAKGPLLVVLRGYAGTVRAPGDARSTNCPMSSRSSPGTRRAAAGHRIRPGRSDWRTRQIACRVRATWWPAPRRRSPPVRLNPSVPGRAERPS